MHRAFEYEVAAGLNIGNRLNTGAGYKLRVPAIDIAEVGAGGGSLVTIDAAGAVHVGPESAGAVPGPVCYARGGCQPTLTDANLLLGYLNPTALLGGQLPVDRGLCQRVFLAHVAGPLGLDVLVAAYGVHQIALGNIVRAVRAISSERGRDPRGFAIVAYGGNGPLHGVSAALELGVPLVVVPPSPGVFSAFGLLAADPSQHAARSFLRLTTELTPETLEAAYRELEQQVTDTLVAIAPKVTRWRWCTSGSKAACRRQPGRPWCITLRSNACLRYQSAGILRSASRRAPDASRGAQPGRTRAAARAADRGGIRRHQRHPAGLQHPP